MLFNRPKFENRTTSMGNVNVRYYIQRKLAVFYDYFQLNYDKEKIIADNRNSYCVTKIFPGFSPLLRERRGIKDKGLEVDLEIPSPPKSDQDTHVR